MQRPQMSFQKNMIISNLYAGTLFLSVGILGLTEAFPALEIALSAVLFALLVFAIVCETPKPEEKTRQHIGKAYSKGFLVILTTLIALGVLEIAAGADFEISDVTSVCLGVAGLVIGRTFKTLEKIAD